MSGDGGDVSLLVLRILLVVSHVREESTPTQQPVPSNQPTSPSLTLLTTNHSVDRVVSCEPLRHPVTNRADSQTSVPSRRSSDPTSFSWEWYCPKRMLVMITVR
jgi:hypothetical protein